MKKTLLAFFLVPFGVLMMWGTRPVQAQNESDLEVAVLSLSESVDRLAKVIEKESAFRVEDRESRRVSLAVSILGLRYRKIERLESELREIQQEEEQLADHLKRVKGEMEAQEEKRRSELSQATPEEKMMAAQFEKELKIWEERLARLGEQKAVLQNQISAEQRRLGDLETLVDAWLAKLH